MKPKVIFLVVVLITCLSCSSKFEPFKPKPLDIQPYPAYSIQEQLNSIPKPDKIIRQYGKIITNDDGTQNIVFLDSPDNADVFILNPEELNKINQLKELAIAYKSIIIAQETLINTKIQTANELLTLIKMTERERDYAISAWENSENMYRYEASQHRKDNLINRVGMYFITVGSIVLMVVGL
jgi:hypothetical protein